MNEYTKLSAVAKRLGVSRRIVYYWARQGTLPGCIQIGSTWLARTADLEHFLVQKHAERGEQIEPETRLSKRVPRIAGRIIETDEHREFVRRMTEDLIRPVRFSRPVSELRQAVEDGSATKAERAELRTHNFWLAWSVDKPSLPPALRERFYSRTVTEADIDAIRPKKPKRG
jgi:excisionase family DNA binding protein